MPNSRCVAILVLLLASCASASGREAAGRRIEITAFEGRKAPLVCVEPQRGVVPAWPQPNPDALSPPPFSLLRDGPFLTCRALQVGAVSAEGYRAASLDQGDALIHAQAAADLLRIGARDKQTVAELRDWHLASPFLQIGCRAAARLAASGAERVALDILSYCGALHAAHTSMAKELVP